MTEEKKYKPKEAAPMLGIAKSTLYEWVRDKKIDHYRKGGRIEFTQAHIDGAYRFVPAVAGDL